MTSGCSWCGAPLDRGFDVFLSTLPSQLPHSGRPRRPGQLQFVCLDQCPPPTRRIVVRYAWAGSPWREESLVYAPVLTGAGHG